MLITRPNFKEIKYPNLALLANEIKTDIIKRTQKGLDIHNRPFTAYSKSYKEWKSKGYGNTVNLTVSGDMLNSITWREIPKGIEFYFSNNESNKKAYDNTIKNDREFFNIDPIQKEKILKKL